MYSYDRTAATLDKSTLEKWKRDLRVMTKIYRSIDADRMVEWDTPEEVKQKQTEMWREAQTLFKRFRDNFEQWVYKVVLPKDTKGRSPLEQDVAKSAWNFRFYLESTTLFPMSRSGAYEPNWPDFRLNQEKNVKRYQVAATKAFNDLESYLEARDGKLERRDYIEHFNVGGVNVVILNWGRDNFDDREEDLDSHLRNLRDRIEQIKRAGFPGAVKGLTLTIDFDQKEWDTNGMYKPAEDTLIMFPLGLAGKDSGHGTLTHECGHRFYFRELPGQARAYWEEVFTLRGLKITTDDISRFGQAVVRKYDPNRPGSLMDSEERLKAALPLAQGEEDEVKFRELARSALMPISAKTFSAEWYLDFLNSKAGEVVQLEEITDYANANPMEAFAEIFKIWVLNGPGALGPWTRDFFRRICRAGGAKLAATRSKYVSVFS